MAAARTLLARHADVLVTMDDARREIRDGALFIRGNRIEQVGATRDLPGEADTVIDLAGHVVLPGLVNTTITCSSRSRVPSPRRRTASCSAG